jgi:hypothetical protein
MPAAGGQPAAALRMRLNTMVLSTVMPPLFIVIAPARDRTGKTTTDLRSI